MQILQISAFFYSTINWKLSHKIMVEIIHKTQDIFLKQIFSQNFSLFSPYDVILTPKKHLLIILDRFQPFTQLKHIN